MSTRLWSVTELMKAGLGNSNAIVGWAVKVTAEYAVENLDWLATVAAKDRDAALKLVKDARWASSAKAMLRGSEIHAAAEQIVYGEKPDVAPEHQPYVDQYVRFLTEHEPVFEMAEAVVINATYHYAGTLDAIVTIGGRKCVLDMKTTPKRPGGVDGARPPFPEIALQLVAYRNAEQVCVSGVEQITEGRRRYYAISDATVTVHMPATDGALALVVSPFDYELIPIRTDDEVWTSWLYVREMARWQISTSQRVIGKPVAPDRKEALA